MKKYYIISIVFLIVFGYMATPIPIANAKITLEENAMHAFIEYEQNFLALNQKNASMRSKKINKEQDDRYQIQDLSKARLLLNFERSAYALNQMILTLKKQYPFLITTIKKFNQWKTQSEYQLLRGKYLLYWQGPLLSYQLQMMALINDKYSQKNWLIEKHLQQMQADTSALSDKQKTNILEQFGKTTSPKLISEQLEILSHYPFK